jgi:hypothetical protein
MLEASPPGSCRPTRPMSRTHRRAASISAWNGSGVACSVAVASQSDVRVTLLFGDFRDPVFSILSGPSTCSINASMRRRSVRFTLALHRSHSAFEYNASTRRFSAAVRYSDGALRKFPELRPIVDVVQLERHPRPLAMLNDLSCLLESIGRRRLGSRGNQGCYTPRNFRSWSHERAALLLPTLSRAEHT